MSRAPVVTESLRDLLIRTKNLVWRLPDGETKELLLWMLKEAIAQARKETKWIPRVGP